MQNGKMNADNMFEPLHGDAAAAIKVKYSAADERIDGVRFCFLDICFVIIFFNQLQGVLFTQAMAGCRQPPLKRKHT